MSSPSRPFKYLIGKTFGLLSVESLSYTRHPSGRRYYKAICKCTCGNRKPISVISLRAGRTTSCGCRRDQYLKITGSRNSRFSGYKEIRGTTWKGFKECAKRRGLDFTITLEYVWDLYLSQGRKCALSGELIHFGRSSHNTDTNASLDRIDAKLGYIPGNVQWVSKQINIARNTLSVSDFVRLCRAVADHENGGSMRQLANLALISRRSPSWDALSPDFDETFETAICTYENYLLKNGV